MFNTSKKAFSTSMVAGFAFIAGMSVAGAGPFVGAIPPFPDKPTLDEPAPVANHPGKEYSEEFDRDAAGTLNVQQTVRFDGRLPSGVINSTDFNGVSDPEPAPFFQIDALANKGDAFYRQVVSNQTAILFSTRVGPNAQGAGIDAGAPGCGPNPICFETTKGAIGLWATALQVTQHAGAVAPDGGIVMANLDALEVWGPDTADDANAYSLWVDGFAGAGVSIFNADGSTFLSHAALVAALIAFDPRFDGVPTGLIDLDALMILEGDFNDTFDDGDSIMFSLWPIAGALGLADVGDAVYVWDATTGISLLAHGGHLWSNGWLGLNIDAIEAAAIPEPATLALLGLGLAGLGAARRRRAG